MNSIFKNFGTVIILLVVSAVFVNISPSFLGAEIELMIILSGVWGLIVNSLYTLPAVPAFCAILMSVYRGGALLCNAGLCAFIAFLIFLCKNKEGSFNPLLPAFVFALKKGLSGKFDFLFVIVNTLIFCFVYLCAISIKKRRIKGIF